MSHTSFTEGQGLLDSTIAILHSNGTRKYLWPLVIVKKNQIQTFVQRLKCFILMAMWFDTFNISKNNILGIPMNWYKEFYIYYFIILSL